MEIITFIIYLFVLWLIVKFILSIIRTVSYKKILKQVSKKMYSEEYQNSNIKKERIEHIKKIGLEQVLEEIITEARKAAIKSLKIKPEAFKNKAIQNAEEEYKIEYARVHGQIEEYQKIKQKISN